MLSDHTQAHIGRLPPPAHGADVWMSGKAPQFVAEWFKVKVPWRRRQDDDGSDPSSTAAAAGWCCDGGSARYEPDKAPGCGGDE